MRICLFNKAVSPELEHTVAEVSRVWKGVHLGVLNGSLVRTNRWVRSTFTTAMLETTARSVKKLVRD